MAQLIATNTFDQGMIMDLQDLSASNQGTVKALNATIASFNGHEGVLQNDSGNVRLENANITEGFVPIGSVEFGGVIYIVSVKEEVVENNNIKNTIEIGSFPSPQYPNISGKLTYKYAPLQVMLDPELDNSPTNFRTNIFGFSLYNPVSVLAEPSFDGSVNLILNDGKNKPRLINTGFHVKDNNTYELIKRYGENNTNQYINDSSLDLTTSLYRDYSWLSCFEYLGSTSGGKLKVGNYVFYAVSCDKDGNESDIICESGMVPVFLGTDGDPKSVSGGLLDELSDKSIKLLVKNVDSAYSYLKFYYSRSTSADDMSSTTLFYKINLKYPVKNNECNVIITGYEDIEQTDSSAINIQYFNSSSAKAQALNQNMLFLGNVSEVDEDITEDLIDISLHFVPKANLEEYVDIDSDYNSEEGKNYYNSKFIYEKTGYHDGEYYRFGIVYIKDNNSLTLVYDVTGNLTLKSTNVNYSQWFTLDYLNAENTYEFTYSNYKELVNNKGVCRFNNLISDEDINKIIGIEFNYIKRSTNIDLEIELKNLGIKGYFFVRQKRIPTIIAQGFGTKICETAYLPAIPLTAGTNTVYNYESFITTTDYSGNNTNEIYYPIVLGKASAYNLRHSYKARLFSLTDKAECFLDKKADVDDPINKYWEHIGYLFDSDLWLDNYTTVELYGDNNKYMAIMSSNSSGKKDGTYYTDFYFFMEAEELFRSILNIDLNSSIQTILNNSELFEECSKTGDNPKQYYYVDDRYQTALEYNVDYVSVIKWDDERLSDLRNYWNPRSIFYLDENGTTKQAIGSESVFCAKGGKIYIFYGTGPVYAEELQSTYNRKAIDFFAKYKHDINNTIYARLNISNLGSGNATLNLNEPTYNGKFSYTSNDDTRVSSYTVKVNPMEKDSYGLFCPEFELNQPYYNNIFTGEEFRYREISNGTIGTIDRNYEVTIDKKANNGVLNKDDNRQENPPEQKVRAIAVSEGNTLNNIRCESKGLIVEGYPYFDNEDNHYFSATAGTANEVGFKFAGPEFLYKTQINEEDKTLINNYPFNIVRGIYSSYVGLVSDDNLCGKIIEIRTNDYDNMDRMFENRAKDPSPYYAISDRISVADNNNQTFYRGDCFINYFTHRVNRNFNDSTSPYNDTIIDIKTFKNNFNKLFTNEYRKFDLSRDSEAASNINIGDLNAVLLGSWITFPVRTSMNTALRSEDASNIAEKLECGHNRSFYPRRGIDSSGSNKIPDSTAYNLAYSKSGGDKIYFNLEDLIYSKHYYKNRILYSNVLQKDSISNGNRIFLSTHYKDYTDLYGEIVKLLSIGSNLLCVCEHGVLLIPVNERALAGEGAGGNIYINTSNVLPDNPVVVSDTYGSKHPESVIQTPYGVFGVDVESKKIWQTDGLSLTIISDFKIQSFLNDYLKLDNVIKINTCNIKTHFNKGKNDVMFTLYDGNNSWNLCYNINQQLWITFYSWIPLLSENIGNCLISIPLKENFVSLGFYKHGFSSRIPSASPKPTYWYDEQHPFEFEFIVKENPTYHKIFDNLQIVSNNTPPESFHYDIIGDCYNFSEDKPNIYYRLELTKKVLNNLFGSHILSSDIDYVPIRLEKSTIFPMYYNKCNFDNTIYNSYKQLSPEEGYNYDSLSGTEVLYNSNLNEYHLCNHVKAVDISGKGGILRGNMVYREDIWKVQINPINLVQKNESNWNKIPIVLNNIKVDDATVFEIEESKLEDGYTASDISVWDISKRKEVKVKDKYIKIRIRYTGDKYALISAINTLYTISFA